MFCRLRSRLIHINAVRRARDAVEIVCECRQSAGNVTARQRLPVSRCDSFGTQSGQALNRVAGGVPIGGEVRRWTVQLRPLRGDGEERLLLGCDKRVAGNQRAIALAKQRDMSNGVAGGVNPAPVGKPWDAAVFGEEL